MTSNGNVVGFPSGEVLVPARPVTVSGIAERLHRKLGRARARLCPPARVAVSLEALSGVADPTIDRLSAVSAAGSITPETAVRLALRHARELGAGRPPPPPPPPPIIRGLPGVYDLHISGEGTRSFAVRIASVDGEPWIGSAALPALGPLLRVCPDGRAICLLVGRAAAFGVSVRLVTTPAWKVTFVGRSMRPGWRTLRHLVVIGGFPTRRGENADLAAAIAHHLKAQPHLNLLAKETHVLRPGVLQDPRTVRMLRLLAIALPGLLGSDQPGGRS